MAVQLSSYMERVDDISPSSLGFTLSSARGTMSLFLTDSPQPTDINSAITQILGSLKTTPSDGRLQRTPPLAHPQCPWLYAAAIQTIRGIGKPVETASQPLLEVPPLPNYATYTQYQFDVEFQPRPYVVAQDSSIPLLKDQVWYDEKGAKQSSPFAAEWLRYAWFQTFPTAESITCNLGYMKFRTSSGSAPDGIQFTGQPRIFMPNQRLKIYWQGVPYRYVTSKNSYIAKYIGYVNQLDFTTWKAGCLQYLNYNAKIYTPPVQQTDAQYTGASGYIYSAEKWCDIEFDFLLTTRALPSASEAITPSNKNWIVAGHNLQPWLTDRGFHYTTTFDPTNAADTSKWYPLWNSFPVQLLFTDPDAAGVYKIPT